MQEKGVKVSEILLFDFDPWKKDLPFCLPLVMWSVFLWYDVIVVKMSVSESKKAESFVPKQNW